MRGRFEVIEVDAQGRPRRVLRQNVETGEMGEEEFVEGYGPLTPPEANTALWGEDAQGRPLAQGYAAWKGREAVHEYDPIRRMEKEQR